MPALVDRVVPDDRQPLDHHRRCGGAGVDKRNLGSACTQGAGRQGAHWNGLIGGGHHFLVDLGVFTKLLELVGRACSLLLVGILNHVHIAHLAHDFAAGIFYCLGNLVAFRLENHAVAHAVAQGNLDRRIVGRTIIAKALIGECADRTCGHKAHCQRQSHRGRKRPPPKYHLLSHLLLRFIVLERLNAEENPASTSTLRSLRFDFPIDLTSAPTAPRAIIAPTATRRGALRLFT